MEDNILSRKQFIETVIPGNSHITFLEKTAGGIQSDEFIHLFDGKSLTGWHQPTSDNGAKWQVEDGVLTGQQDPPGSGKGGILLTDQVYGDFELIIDLAPDWGIDSGLFLRTNAKGECFQVYVDYYDRGNIGSISTVPPEMKDRMIIRPYTIFSERNTQGDIVGFTSKPDEREIAWDPDYLKYCATPEEWIVAWKINQWNTLRIRCVGKYPRITTWINYTKIVEFDGATCPHPRYDRVEMADALGREGAIALQVHGGAGAWKKGAKGR